MFGLWYNECDGTNLSATIIDLEEKLKVKVVENYRVHIPHQKPEDVQRDRARYKERVQSAVEKVNIVATSNPLVIEGYSNAVIEAVKNLGPRITVTIAQPGMSLNTEGYFSINAEWSKGEWEIVGLN